MPLVPEAIFWDGNQIKPTMAGMVDWRGLGRCLAELWNQEILRVNRHRGVFKRVENNIFGGC
jgi:hypothetical protein